MTIAHRSPPAIHRNTAPEADAYLSLLLVLHAQITRLCILAALNSCVANALCAGNIPVNWRLLLTWYPRMPAPLIIASQRIGRFWPETKVAQMLDMFQGALNAANQATIDFISGGRSSNPSIAALAHRHRAHCRACDALLSQIETELASRSLTRTITPSVELRSLMQSALSGQWTGLSADGQMEFPPWADRRLHHRVHVHCPAQLIAAEATPVVVKNISLAGVGLELSRAVSLRSGEPVMLVLEQTQQLPSTVVWQNNELAALKFDEPLTHNDPRLSFCHAFLPAEDSDGPQAVMPAKKQAELFDIAD